MQLKKYIQDDFYQRCDRHFKKEKFLREPVYPGDKILFCKDCLQKNIEYTKINQFMNDFENQSNELIDPQLLETIQREIQYLKSFQQSIQLILSQFESQVLMKFQLLKEHMQSLLDIKINNLNSIHEIRVQGLESFIKNSFIKQSNLSDKALKLVGIKKFQDLVGEMKSHKGLSKQNLEFTDEIKTKINETEENIINYLNKQIESLVTHNKESQIFDLQNMDDSWLLSQKKESIQLQGDNQENHQNEYDNLHQLQEQIGTIKNNNLNLNLHQMIQHSQESIIYEQQQQQQLQLQDNYQFQLQKQWNQQQSQQNQQQSQQKQQQSKQMQQSQQQSQQNQQIKPIELRSMTNLPPGCPTTKHEYNLYKEKKNYFIIKKSNEEVWMDSQKDLQIRSIQQQSLKNESPLRQSSLSMSPTKKSTPSTYKSFKQKSPQLKKQTSSHQYRSNHQEKQETSHQNNNTVNQNFLNKIIHNKTQQNIQTIVDAQVLSALFTKDQKQIITGCTDSSIYVLNNDNLFQKKFQFQGHTRGVTTLALTKDDDLLISGSQDRLIKVWDMKHQICLHTLNEHTNSINSLTVSPNHLNMVSGGDEGLIIIWNVKRFFVIKSLYGHSDPITYVQYSKDGLNFVSAGKDGAVKIWDAHSYQMLRQLNATHNLDSNYSCSLSPDGKLLAVAGQKNKISIVDFKTLQVINEFQHHKHPVQNVMFSKNSKNIFSSDESGQLTLIDIENIRFKQYLIGHKNNIKALCLSENENQLITGSFSVFIWGIDSCKSYVQYQSNYEY